jgi:CheY-like chemotaxis protein/DNA-directed RNA polymerase subunit RPC12/RpoP
MPKNKMNDILVVDDNLRLLSLLSATFAVRGYTVRTASDGFEALAAIRKRAPDILLSDLNMPGMSGFELLSVVRRRFPVIAVIAMSGEHTPATTSPEIAADGFYAKGSSNVGALLEILSTIGDQEFRQSRRATAPIWTAGLPIHQGDRSSVAVACSECLRVFTLPLKDGTVVTEESRCPHCSYSVQLAIVRQLGKADTTAFHLTTAATQISQSAYAR